MRNLVFFVNDASWLEHNRVGIAGINEPQANSARQKAIAEIAGITPGDRIFFRLGRSGEHPTQIVGLFTATSEPYFDPNPLFPGALRVDHRLSLRVEFDCFRNYPNPVDIEHLWLSKERGSLWTIQQARGDIIGRHACVSRAPFAFGRSRSTRRGGGSRRSAMSCSHRSFGASAVAAMQRRASWLSVSASIPV
jgi:hypothetical protein